MEIYDFYLLVVKVGLVRLFDPNPIIFSADPKANHNRRSKTNRANYEVLKLLRNGELGGLEVHFCCNWNVRFVISQSSQYLIGRDSYRC